MGWTLLHGTATTMAFAPEDMYIFKYCCRSECFLFCFMKDREALFFFFFSFVAVCAHRHRVALI